MSQVSFKTEYMGVPVEVVSGWDQPLQYYHFTIFDLRPDADTEYIYSCLDEKNCFSTKTTERWQKKLEQMGITAPPGFWDIAENKNLGNSIFKYKDKEQMWEFVA